MTNSLEVDSKADVKRQMKELVNLNTDQMGVSSIRNKNKKVSEKVNTL